MTSAFGLSAFTADILLHLPRCWFRVCPFTKQGARVLKMSYPTSQVERNYVLYARMQNAKNLFTILKAINFKEVSVRRCEVYMLSIHTWPLNPALNDTNEDTEYKINLL